jgi:two-component system nitrogen regulation sensor histidine kinase GlnL
MQAQTRVELDQAVNIHSVIEHVRQLVVADRQPVFEFFKDYDPSLPEVKGNRELLVQALINVIHNAADAVADIGSHGKILIRTRIDHLITDTTRRQVVRIDIEDNGSGIEPEIQSLIFDPMVTSKPEGSGLGLPISAEIISQHGGVLDFQRAKDTTTFRVFLPLYLDHQRDGLNEGS